VDRVGGDFLGLQAGHQFVGALARLDEDQHLAPALAVLQHEQEQLGLRFLSTGTSPLLDRLDRGVARR
jgi:hypothetical protein